MFYQLPLYLSTETLLETLHAHPTLVLTICMHLLYLVATYLPTYLPTYLCP